MNMYEPDFSGKTSPNKSPTNGKRNSKMTSENYLDDDDLDEDYNSSPVKNKSLGGLKKSSLKFKKGSTNNLRYAEF